MEKTIKEIEKITENKRFITTKQLKELWLIPEVYIEHAGLSGTGKGYLYVLYLIKDGEKTDEELAEIILIDEEG